VKDGDPGAVSVSEQLDAEVDSRSRVLIEFNRPAIERNQQRFEADVSIAGQVKDKEGVRNIEIPGYSLIGEEQAKATARLRSAKELKPTLEVLAKAGEELERVAVEKIPEATTRSSFKGISSQLYVQRYIAGELPVSEVVKDRPTAMSLVDSVLERQTEIRVAAGKLVLASNRRVLDAIVDPDRTDADLMLAHAKEALDALDALIKIVEAPDGGLPEKELDRVKAARRVFQALRKLKGLKTASEEDTNTKLFSFLKDTSILVSQTGAEPGDVILLRITNGEGSLDLNRSVTIALRVRSFGWNKSISDSALLMYRLSASRSETARRIAEARETARAGGIATSVETPDVVNFIPAPGVTLGVTLSSRRDKKFLRAVQPGFGMNVSFPQFSSTTTRFVPVADAAPTMSVDEPEKQIDVSAGLVFSLFDNAVQFSYGKTLTASQKRDYFAVGFGFVKVIEKIRELTTSEE
jgi:hypothetical protein